MYVPKPIREIFRRSISYHGATLWKKLPYEIKCINDCRRN